MSGIGSCGFGLWDLKDPKTLIVSHWGAVIVEVPVDRDESQCLAILDRCILGLAQLL